MTPANPIKVLLIDDHPAVRQGLALLLAPEGIEVCAEAGGRTEAVARLETSQPDLAIVDLSLDGEDGLGLISDLQRRDVPALIYSMHSDPRRVSGALAAGALGYVTKRELYEVLLNAIGEVAARRRFVSPRAAAALAEGLAASSPAPAKLSQRELDIFRLLGRGESTARIGAALALSAHTVESYYARIRDKVSVDSMQDLRRLAIEDYHRRAR